MQKEETSLGLWGFEEYVLYLCAISKRVSPTDRQLIERIEANVYTEQREVRRQLVEECLGCVHPEDELAVCFVALHTTLDLWLAFELGSERYSAGDRAAYRSATHEIKFVESLVAGYDTLCECAIEATAYKYRDRLTKAHYDAALAAATVGAFKTAYDILANAVDLGPDEPGERERASNSSPEPPIPVINCP